MMTEKIPHLVIAVSSSALFDTEASCRVFADGGVSAFVASEQESTTDPLSPGLGFEVIKRIHHWGALSGIDIRIAVVSRRDPITGARILRSLGHHGLTQAQGSFTSGVADIVPYLKAFGANLFLSLDGHDVQAAIDAGIPAAQLLGAPVISDDELLRIAVDGDAVLFSNESEKYFRANGLEAFLQHEHENVHVPLELGPIMPFVQALGALEKAAGCKLVRIALVTARQGLASERAIRTLASCGVAIDEAHFCGPTPKAGILEAFAPHLFFDDSETHLLPAARLMTAARVPWVTSDETAAPAP